MIKKITVSEFNKLLITHPNENVELINLISSFLKEKRGYVINLKRADDVILLCSGGMDSIVTFLMLLQNYNFRIHPVFIKTLQKRNKYELKAFLWYYNYFKKSHGNRIAEYFTVTYPSSVPEIATKFKKNLSQTLHPQVLRNRFSEKDRVIHIKRSFLYPAFLTFPGALSATFFDLSRNTKIRTIICSILPSDGEYNASQSLTSLRSTMLSLCSYTNDYSWQILSMCIENELGLWLDKQDLVRISKKNNLPLENTYSCLKGTPLNCGYCLACSVRKKAFILSGVRDKTEYFEDKTINKVKKSILHLTNKLNIFKTSKKIIINDYY